MTKQKHEKLGTFVGTYLVAWAIFVGLVLNPAIIPLSIGKWLAVIISAVFISFLCYMYLYKPKERLTKSQELSGSERSSLVGNRIVQLLLVIVAILVIGAMLWALIFPFLPSPFSP